MNFQKYFNRFEIKYQIPLEERDKITRLLGGFMNLDENAIAGYGYEIRSLYFDSPFNHAYYQKINGEEMRRKLRIRYYPNFVCADGNEIVFIEIKRKINDNVSKARLTVPMNKVFEILENKTGYAKEFYANCSHDDQKTLGEITYMIQRFHLKPVIMVSYQRQAFEGKFETQFRLTFDTKVVVRKSNFDFHHGGGELIVPNGTTIMELKFNNYIPDWALRIANSNNCVQNKISKFADGCERIL